MTRQEAIDSMATFAANYLASRELHELEWEEFCEGLLKIAEIYLTQRSLH